MTTIHKFGFYRDADLAVPVTGPLVAAQQADGTTPPVDFTLYLGSPDSNYRLDSLGGNIEVAITDADPGSGHEPAEIRLALTAAGLAGATPGASLDLGVTSIDGGKASAIPVHVRVDDQTGIAGDALELGIQVSDVAGVAA